MPPIKKIIRDVIDAHHAHHDERRAERKLCLKQRLQCALGDSNVVRRARALDGEDKEARRQTILDAAEHLFAERHELANVADVARAAGLAKGTVYLYFETKEELYLALHMREVEQFFTTLIARLESSTPMSYDEIEKHAWKHILDAPTYLPLATLCCGFAADAVPFEANVNFQTRLTNWLLTAGSGLEQHFPKLAAGEGVRMLKHSYAMMIGLFVLSPERNNDPKVPKLPNLGTYQEETAIALRRYWAQVAGIDSAAQSEHTK